MTKYDFIILAILLMFALIGFLRGFVTELFEAVGIVVAVLYGKILAAKIAHFLPDAVPEYMRIPLTTFVLSILLIFIIKAIGGAIRKAFVKKSFKGIDHFLGGFMGAGKGVVVVVCIMAILSLTQIARLFEMEKKPAPVLRWTMKQSKPVLARYTQKIDHMVKTKAQEALHKQPVADEGSKRATIENLSPSLSKADRADIIKLLKEPAIASLNLTEEALLKMVYTMRESQGKKSH